VQRVQRVLFINELMDSTLKDVWDSGIGTPFAPTIGKGAQFWVGGLLLLVGILLTGLFGLNRSFLNIWFIGAPASLALAFGSVYMICAVGVYV